jgi:hypothetical protein
MKPLDEAIVSVDRFYSQQKQGLYECLGLKKASIDPISSIDNIINIALLCNFR